MTLLATELVFPPGGNPFIVFAADRRISVDGERDSERPKIFAIPQHRAGIGYFGLAHVHPNGQRVTMDRWIAEFLARRSGTRTLAELAASLASELQRDVLPQNRRTFVSGFHLAGLGDDGAPEFWFIRNVENDRTTVFGRYDRRRDFGPDNSPPSVAAGHVIFRNGDIRAHVAAWERMGRPVDTFVITAQGVEIVTHATLNA